MNKQTYWTLFKNAGGVPFVILVNLIMLVFITINITCNFFMQHWAYASDDHQQAFYAFYSSTIFVFAVSAGVFAFLRVSVIMCYFQQALKTIHNKYLNMVFSAPVNVYFDITPLPKILNRFSKDLSMMDESLWLSFSSLLGCAYIVLSSLIVAGIAVYWMIIVVCVFAVLAFWLFSYTLPVYTDTNRI